MYNKVKTYILRIPFRNFAQAPGYACSGMYTSRRTRINPDQVQAASSDLLFQNAFKFSVKQCAFPQSKNFSCLLRSLIQVAQSTKLFTEISLHHPTTDTSFQSHSRLMWNSTKQALDFHTAIAIVKATIVSKVGYYRHFRTFVSLSRPSKVDATLRIALQNARSLLSKHCMMTKHRDPCNRALLWSL